MRRRLPLPDRIENAPRLLPGLDLYYDAFQYLSTCRQVGFSFGPIPCDAIDAYADRREFSDNQREDLFFVIREMDNAFILHHRDRKD